jgi:hypothetical protein
MSDHTDEPKGRAKGGFAVALKMTPEQLQERARKGALTRWASQGLKASHKGNFQVHFGIDADCYVLDDERKTAVMTQRGIAAALGLKNPGGKDFERLVKRKSIAKHLGAEVLEKVMQPIEFKWFYPGAKQSSISIKGYSAEMLTEVCAAILKADAAGDLQRNQYGLIKQAAIINGAAANAGIQGLVYALAGYRPEIDEVIQAFRAFVQEEAKKYEKEFPSELYIEWARLYSISAPIRGRSWKHKHLTVDHIYHPLAKSDGKLLTLLREAKAADGGSKKLFQFLNEVGVRAIRMHLGRVLEMAESSVSKDEYEAKISARFGGQQSFNFPSVSLPPSSQ